MIISPRVVAIVRSLDGQILHNLALLHVHDVHAVSVADGHANVSAVRNAILSPMSSYSDIHQSRKLRLLLGMNCKRQSGPSSYSIFT
jgi:hypothetical protein